MSNEQTKRALILSTAKIQADSNSHYLNGSDGATPDSSDGLGRFLNLQEDLTIEKLGVHAASNSYGLCKGRYSKVNGKKFIKGQKDRDELLPAYLEELKSSWLSYFYYPDFNNTGLYPRRDSNFIYLGEDCRNKRHFDCESFIGWVICHALKKDAGTWRKSIEWFNKGGDGRLDVWNKNNFPKQSEMLDGDILIRLQTKTNDKGEESVSRHIGFVSAGGKYIVHASGSAVGVISQLYAANTNWTALARIKSNYL